MTQEPLGIAPRYSPAMRRDYFTGGPAVELYDAIHLDAPVLNGDVAFYLRQARQTGGPILELGCGTGRVSVPLQQAGFEVVGLDLSPRMLAIARAKAPEVRWVRGAMERFDLGRRFRLILIPFRAFQHLLEVDDQRRCLASARRHLARRGRLVIHLFDPRLDLCVPEPPLGPTLGARARDPRTGHRWEARVESRSNDPVRQTFRETWLWTERGDRGRVLRLRRDVLELRWTYRWEMRHLLELEGFEPLACHGDFHGGPPRYGAEQVWVCRRA